MDAIKKEQLLRLKERYDQVALLVVYNLMYGLLLVWAILTQELHIYLILIVGFCAMNGLFGYYIAEYTNRKQWDMEFDGQRISVKTKTKYSAVVRLVKCAKDIINNGDGEHIIRIGQS